MQEFKRKQKESGRDGGREKLEEEDGGVAKHRESEREERRRGGKTHNREGEREARRRGRRHKHRLDRA